MSIFTGTVLITGGTVGLGYETALKIAREHPDLRVIIASRSDKESAAAAINEATGRQSVTYLPLDLAKLGNVRTFAENYAKKNYPPIKALLLNAALQFPGDVSYSEDGIEKTFAITHVGHALLYYLLESQLALDARIVVSASGVHYNASEERTGMPEPIYRTAEELAHPTAETARYPGRQRYSSSKLANVMWVKALNRHIQQSGKEWTVNAFDPGLMPGTGLAREASPILIFLWLSVLPRILPVLRYLVSTNIHTTAESGAALARLGLADDVKGESGLYFEGLKVREASAASRKVSDQDDLWSWTAKAVAKNQAEAETFEKV